MSEPQLFVGEDILAASCAESSIIQAKAALFRQSGDWEEVVAGMSDLTVKYDPLKISSGHAEQKFLKLWAMPVGGNAANAAPVMLAADFSASAGPDTAAIAKALGVAHDKMGQWLCARTFRVTMMGFQPGFAYLEDVDGADLPILPRLDSPRQSVLAGSIGFLGKRACIYALDGPGGWPIVGRVQQPLFRRNDPSPFLLSPGESLRFHSV
jgi:KipI family sensor histidine kinase inhibitor